MKKISLKLSYQKLNENRIVVRRAKPGEIPKTLDEIDRDLTEEHAEYVKNILPKELTRNLILIPRSGFQKFVPNQQIFTKWSAR